MKGIKFLLVWGCFILFAQNGMSETPTQEKKTVIQKIRLSLKKVESLLDSMAVKRVKPEYVEVPKQPWRAMVQTTIGEQIFKPSAYIYNNSGGNFSVEPEFSTGTEVSTGIRLGYRTANLVIMRKLGHLKGSGLSFGTNGNRFGFNIQQRKFKTNNFKAPYTFNNETTQDKLNLEKPVNVKSLYFDAYYVFNNRRFSNSSTRSLAFIQRRSAGSFIIGISYLNYEAEYVDVGNWVLISRLNQFGRMKMKQWNINVGYAYNWVPLKNWCFSLTAMPQVTIDNKLIFDKYQLYSYDENGNFSPRLLFEGTQKVHGNMRLSLLGRAAVVYNHNQWFASLSGQWQEFTFRHTEKRLSEGNTLEYTNYKTKGLLTNWTANVNIGYRF